jgi:hypothetical protein
VDDAGYESGFSDLFWALRLSNPNSVALDANDQRIILDPQNGYALLLQSPDDVYLDTIGSYDLHLENSQYMVRDPAGRLVISHPGDWYSSRHSVRVTDPDATLLFEFGERGSGPGQFETPTGVATWQDPCTYGGPYLVDAHTLLLLHFDDSYAGAQGEPGMPDGTTFVGGQYGQGVLVEPVDRLTYAAAGNIERERGAVEFWINPHWDGDDGQSYTLFEVGDAWFNRLRIMKDGANNLRLMLWDSTTEYGVAYNVAHWQAEEWHHVAATWDGPNIALYVDGEQRAGGSSANPPDTLASTIYVGSSLWHDQQADAVIDELRISDIPRIGNSDTCAYRILVADSGNHRVQVFDGGGSYISAHGGYGSDPGEFDNPQGLAVDSSGHVIVADRGNDRLQVFSFDGVDLSFVRIITAGLNGPTGLATYGPDRIIVADTGSNKVKVLDAQGTLLGEYDAPNDGRTGLFSQPRGVAADKSARIVVADTGNRRVVTILDALPVWPPTSVAIAGPTAGTVQVDYVFEASVGSVTTTHPLTYTWWATGKSPEMHTDRGLSDIISFTWNTTGTKVITVTATNGGGTVTNTHAITISEPGVPATSIAKMVTPQGTVNYGDELTYTLVISAAPGIWLGLFDPLEGTTFQRFVERPPGTWHADGVVGGTVYLGGYITGTLEVTPSNQVTVSFVTQVGIPGTAGWTANVTNRACAYPYGETLSGCIWSDEVTNRAFRACNIYLPLMMRTHHHDRYEPNNRPEQAFGPLISGQVYWAFIWDETDTDDYYHFTPTTTDEVTVEVTKIPVGRDYDLWVYSYDGAYIVVGYSDRAGIADEDLAFVPVAGNTYYVRVRPYSGFSNIQPYHLKVVYQ